jgi:hypothetical protein
MLCKVQYSTKLAHLQGLFCTSVHSFSLIVRMGRRSGPFFGAQLLIRVTILAGHTRSACL